MQAALPQDFVAKPQAQVLQRLQQEQEQRRREEEEEQQQQQQQQGQGQGEHGRAEKPVHEPDAGPRSQPVEASGGGAGEIAAAEAVVAEGGDSAEPRGAGRKAARGRDGREKEVEPGWTTPRCGRGPVQGGVCTHWVCVPAGLVRFAALEPAEVTKPLLAAR